MIFFPILLTTRTIWTEVVCFFYVILSNPVNWLFWVANIMIDAIYSVLPETPDAFKIFNLLAKVAEAVPGIGFAVIYEIFIGVTMLLVLYLSVKLLKYIPFIW